MWPPPTASSPPIVVAAAELDGSDTGLVHENVDVAVGVGGRCLPHPSAPPRAAPQEGFLSVAPAPSGAGRDLACHDGDP